LNPNSGNAQVKQKFWFSIFKVSGDSMIPDYKNGDFVVILRSPFCIRRFKIGDTIIFNHIHYGVLIKTIENILPTGELFVRGKVENSLDSRRLGYVHINSVIGKVIWLIGKE
jgi:signal peptidase I